MGYERASSCRPSGRPCTARRRAAIEPVRRRTPVPVAWMIVCPAPYPYRGGDASRVGWTWRIRWASSFFGSRTSA
jgi:hypothetical protein